MRIGIFFQRKPSGGGIYQYCLSILDALMSSESGDEIFLFHLYDLGGFRQYLAKGMKSVKLSPDDSLWTENDFSGGIDLRHAALHGDVEVYFRTRSLSKELAQAARENQIELMVYPHPEREAFEAGLPYLMTVPDIAHLVCPQFPEFTADGVFAQREYVLSNGIRDAALIVTDSETGKAEIVEHYQKSSDQIVALPFVAQAPQEELITDERLKAVREKYSLPERFLFYPAQFWPHKNHQAIVRALGLIKERNGERIAVVFVGSKQKDWGEFEKVLELAHSLDVRAQLKYLGYIDDQDMPALYKLSAGLVMPTFLGPTNIPIVEAFGLGCPVITTDMPGSREQTQGAALLIDPQDPEDLKDAILKLWHHEALCRSLVEKGYQRARAWSPEHFCASFQEIIERVRNNSTRHCEPEEFTK